MHLADANLTCPAPPLADALGGPSDFAAWRRFCDWLDQNREASPRPRRIACASVRENNTPETDCLADEPVAREPVSGRILPPLRTMQGDFEKMQRGANCNRARSGHFSITCIANPYSTSRETVIALAGTFRGETGASSAGHSPSQASSACAPRIRPSYRTSPSIGLGDSSTVEQRTRFPPELSRW